MLAVSADVGLLVLGGRLKVRELLSARLGDVLSQLFIASSILKYHASLPADLRNDQHAEYALRRAFVNAQQALIGFYDNFPVRWLGCALKRLAFPFGVPVKPASDALVRALGTSMMELSPVRTALSACCYRSLDENDALGRLEVTFNRLLQVEQPLTALRKAIRKGEVAGGDFEAQLDDAIQKNVVGAEWRDPLLDYERLRRECLYTDVFDFELKEVKGRA